MERWRVLSSSYGMWMRGTVGYPSRPAARCSHSRQPGQRVAFTNCNGAKPSAEAGAEQGGHRGGNPTPNRKVAMILAQARRFRFPPFLSTPSAYRPLHVCPISDVRRGALIPAANVGPPMTLKRLPHLHVVSGSSGRSCTHCHGHGEDTRHDAGLTTQPTVICPMVRIRQRAQPAAAATTMTTAAHVA